MALQMKRACEGCGYPLDVDAQAYVCSYECTFCQACTQQMDSVCPNCGGALVCRLAAKSDAYPSGQSKGMNLRAKTIIWHRLDMPGHESARVFLTKSRWTLTGTAVFVHNAQPCRLNYLLKCDSKWETISARIAGWIGRRVIGIDILVDSDYHWQLNKKRCDDVTGCIDLDLNFSPMTNTLPIRRLNLAVGEEEKVRAAWLRFPSFKLEPLEQIYRRVKTSKYRYENAGGSFVADLEVDNAGLVTHYPNFWRVEST
jgi:hypothetical protein